ncbi:MAG: immune inhibitor A, partial [Chloroflexota bacterium]
GSNAREMFVMNANYFGSDFYLNVLIHELRHMIEDNYDRGDDAWEGEGAATLAEDLLGYPDNAVGRANRFLAQPDQQLNAWTDGDSIPYYGQGYLLNRYIYDRLGPELYRQFGASPETGLAAIDQVAATNGLELTGHDLWLDWLAAMTLIGRDDVPDDYRLDKPGLASPAMEDVDEYPAAFDEMVHQYAADFYRLTGDGEVIVDFAGSELVPALDTQPVSGQAMWLADRANNSHARLTRTVDLSDVDAATLEYSVYHDIETGYDFGYLFVSEDDGQSWQPLVGENMQGAEQDPSNSALAERFYSGRSDEWRRERIDLTPYAGQEILIRFAYLTDMVLTFGGLAVDDIAIPEIGFYDDGETEAEGWTAEGFERVTGSLPQRWQLQLITFPDGRPAIERLNVAADQTLTHALSLADSDGQAILIVSAWAPSTLQPAGYHLEITAP